MTPVLLFVQEGILDVEVVYSDMTSLPLRYISSENYFLQVIAADHNIVGVTVAVTPPYQPHVVANGNTKYIFSL